MRGLRTFAFVVAVIATAIVATWAVMRQDRTAGVADRVPDAVTNSPAPVVAASSATNACNGSAAAAPADALAQGPKVNAAPTLQIEAAGHIGAIRSLALAKSGAFAVTAGWDKTIRVWGVPPSVAGADVPQPSLDDVLRVPIGGGRMGEAYAVAVSPDETLVAVGGGMSSEFAPDLERVYVFDKLTARIAHVLPVAQKTYALAFSTDGGYLAGGAAAGVGLCVWSTKDWSLVGNDADYGGQINGIDFDATGRIVTTSDDGSIRLYEKIASGMKPARSYAAPSNVTGRHEPRSAAFSPNGALIAVGYRDAADITLHSASDLAATATLAKRTGDGDDQNFPRVAWAHDGKALFAGGQPAASNDAAGSRTFVRRWAIDQGAAVATLGAATSTDITGFDAAGGVQALGAYGDNGAILVTHDGRILAIDGDGKVQFRQAPTRFDWSAKDAAAAASGFKASADGRVVEAKLNDGRFVRFDLARRGLTVGNASAPGLIAAKSSGAALSVSIDDPQNPTLKKGGGEPTDIQVAEPPISLAIASGEKFFALGTHFNIRLYNDAGDLIATEPVTDSVHRVLVVPDQRMVIAALGDGTIRWYAIVRPEHQERWTLEERLALFVHASDNRWVAWTPNGYYDASPGGEDLMGWLLNRGAGASALFYSSGRFRDLYRRPRIVDQALTVAKLEPPPATEAFLAKIPPVVRITGVSNVSQKVRVKYELEWPLQAQKVVEEVFGAIDGASQRGRGFSVEEVEQAIDLSVPEGRGARTISLVARTPESALSDAAILVVPALQATPETGAPGVLRAVVVGVSQYRNNQIRDLTYADADARSVKELLERQKGGRYADVQVTPLTNEGATREAIDAAMRALPDATGPNDLTVLFLAGHGTLHTVRKTVAGRPFEVPTFFFLPFNATANGATIDPATALSVDDIAKAFLDRINGRKAVFLDACRSGQWGAQDGTMLAETVRDQRRGVIVYGASKGDQLALEDRSYGDGHGAFTAALIEAFRGVPAFNRYDPRQFTPRELGVWFDRRVMELTRGKQTPVPLDNSGAAFPMAQTLDR